MFRSLARAYLHFGRIPWWRILLGLSIVGVALVVFLAYPTHRKLLNATTSEDEREAALRVIRAAALIEARNIGLKITGIVEVEVPEAGPGQDGHNLSGDGEQSPSSVRREDPPRIVIADGKISIHHEQLSRTIDASVPEAEERVKDALTAIGIEADRALQQARRILASARRPPPVEFLPPGAEGGTHEVASITAAIDANTDADSEPTRRWHVRIWGIDFEGRGIEDLPVSVAREPLLTPAQQDALERSTRFDVRKGIYGLAALLVYIVFALLLLATRGFAARSARQTQRVKVVEAAAKVDSSARQVAEAQLKAIQAQVEPHFLFNTLSHVKALQEVDVKQAGVMLDNLIAYLRTALPNLREGSSTLGKEFELAQAYLNILKMRMGDRLKFSLDLPESLRNQTFPPALIINLVENAVKHGLERVRGGGSVRLSAQRVGEVISVTVADTGKGLDPTSPTGTGVGLTSIRDRLRLLFGDQASLKLEPNSPHGVIATLTLPIEAPTLNPHGAASAPGLSGSEGRNGLPDDVSECKVHTALILAGLGGFGGAHRWYLRRKKTAIVQAILGLTTIIGLAEGEMPRTVALIFFIWWITDIVLLATKSMKDKEGRRVVIDR